MKKIVIFTGSTVLSLLLFIQPLKSQEEVSGKHIFSELGGPGVIFSANFDSRFKQNTRLGLGYRAGIGFGVGSFSDFTVGEYGNTYTRTYYTIPAGLNYIFGKKHSSRTFEVGGGVALLTRKVSLYCYDYEKPGHCIGYMQFMFRRVPVDGGFTFRIGFTPIIGTSGDLFPMVALSFGYAF
ncbi:MAG: hypothetical protein LBR86_09230 [Tannerella sp.]|jgi:hypothetical protein|nr:hypothetical protein [Tannerella sp.]